jgi:hypothetical protein
MNTAFISVTFPLEMLQCADKLITDLEHQLLLEKCPSG